MSLSYKGVRAILDSSLLQGHLISVSSIYIYWWSYPRQFMGAIMEIHWNYHTGSPYDSSSERQFMGAIMDSSWELS